jgi:hypothetical protein
MFELLRWMAALLAPDEPVALLCDMRRKMPSEACVATRDLVCWRIDGACSAKLERALAGPCA